MSKLIRTVAATALAIGASGAFAATDTATLAVTASIAAVCKVTLSGPMAFGALDPTLTTDATKSVTASYQCTKGTPVTSFTVGGSSSGTYTSPVGMAGTGSNTDKIPFAIGWTTPAAFTGDGLGAAGTARTVTLNGTIANADYVTKTPDSYSTSIGIAVNY